jgi:hypothetical protein
VAVFAPRAANAFLSFLIWVLLSFGAGSHPGCTCWEWIPAALSKSEGAAVLPAFSEAEELASCPSWRSKICVASMASGAQSSGFGGSGIVERSASASRCAGEVLEFWLLR